MDILDVAKCVKPYTQLSGQSFPKLLGKKLSHFVNHVAASGVGTVADLPNWLGTVNVSGTPSTDRLRWDLCGEALNEINRLLIAGKYPDDEANLSRVYTELSQRRLRLRSTFDIPGTDLDNRESDDRSPRSETPFYDRQVHLDKISSFAKSGSESVMVVSGMRGMGKTSLLHAAFRQEIPAVRSSVWVQLTEGISYERLITAVAYKCNIPVAGSADVADEQVLRALESKILQETGPRKRRIVVIDEFQWLLNSNAELADQRVTAFLTKLAALAEPGVTKSVWISDRRPQLPVVVERHCSFLTLRGLDEEDTKRVLRYWFDSERPDLASDIHDPPQAFVSTLGGHPMAAKVGAGLWAQYPGEDLADRVSVFKKLKDRIVPFILGQIDLSDAEKDFLSFSAVFRLPVAREVFQSWGGDDATTVLESFTGRFLVETTSRGYQLHPLIREFFRPRMFTALSRTYHMTAGEYYLSLFEKRKKDDGEFVPEFLGEAVHHLLSAGDRARVQSLAFYAQELRPVALAHYQQRALELALNDYLALADLDPQDADAHAHLALIYGRQRRWQEAEASFSTAQRLARNDRRLLLRLLQGYASAKLTAGLLSEAEELLFRAHEISPRHAPTLVGLGRLMEAKDDPSQAEGYYEKAIDSDGDNAFAHYQLSRLLYKQDKIDEAFYEAKIALGCNPMDNRCKDFVEELRKRVAESEEQEGDR